MCGIAGVLSPNKSIDWAGCVKEMTDFLIHRGPDAQGFYSDPEKGIFLGHRRLSIIDLSEQGKQPMFSEDGGIAVVFNGEIYNYKDLQLELIKKGHKFISQTDTEVIVHGYEEEGENYIKRLRGMFALAIWDNQRRKLVLARDRLGIKPVYYFNRPDCFVFASEVKAFLPLKKIGWTAELDPLSLRFILAFPFIPDNERTILNGVKKLPPGHILTFGLGEKSNLQPFWKLEKKEEYSNLSFLEAKDFLEELLLDTVRLHLQADVPVGVMLSGGLDSSVVAALTKKVATKDVQTFTIGLSNSRLDETRYAREVADHIVSQHHTIEIDSSAVIEEINKAIWLFDDLSTMDSAIYSTYIIGKKIRDYGIKVLLVGEGADEIFGGYTWFGLSQLPFNLLPGFLRNTLYHYVITRVITRPYFWPYLNLINSEIKSYMEEDIFSGISRFEITRQLPNNYLVKVDKATMAASLEARVPYVDHRVVEFVYSLPSSYKLKGRYFSLKKSNEKYLLREVAKDYIPYQISQRKKKGGMFLVNEFVYNNLDAIRGYLFDKRSISSSIFTKRELNRLFSDNNIGFIKKEKETLLWRLYVLEVWAKLYL